MIAPSRPPGEPGQQRRVPALPAADCGRLPRGDHMRIEASQARGRITRLVERISVLEAALERCRKLADKADADTEVDYCREISEVADAALEHSPV